jgi:predicted nucleic acid-binding protein
MGVVLDASVIVDLLEGRDEALGLVQRLESEGERLAVPAPALYEVEVGVRSGQGPGRARAFRGLVDPYEVLPFDQAAAEATAELQADLVAAGSRAGSVDAMVAGVALARGDRVLASDRDFEALKEKGGVPVVTP